MSMTLREILKRNPDWIDYEIYSLNDMSGMYNETKIYVDELCPNQLEDDSIECECDCENCKEPNKKVLIITSG